MAQSKGLKGSRRTFRSSTAVNAPGGLGMRLDTFTAGSVKLLEADQEDQPRLSPLLSEPPPTPTKADLSLNAFAEGTSYIIGPSDDEDAGSEDSAKTLVSPFADPEDSEYMYDEVEPSPPDLVSYWSFSSSSSSSSPSSAASSSSDSDSESEEAEMDFAYDKDPVKILCTDPNGFTSFPSLPPYPDAGETMATFREELLEADKVEAAQELVRAVEEVESEYAGMWSRPLPKWAWLSSSNSFPLYNLGPNDLRHGHSKLRQACSVMGGADTDGKDSTRSGRSNTMQEVAMVGVRFL